MARENRQIATESDRDQLFAVFFGAHRHGVARFVRWRLGPVGDEVDDVVTEVFVVALEKFDKVSDIPDVEARRWLLRVAQFICMRRHRSRSRRDRAYERVVADLISGDDPFSELFEVDEGASRVLADQVREVLGDLPTTYGEVLQLDMAGELSGQQMADALGATHTAVRVRLTRARKLFRERYERQYGNPLHTRGGDPS